MNNTTFMLLYVVGFGALMYFLFIRPQQKRQKEFAALLAALTIDDQIVSAGGIYGTIRAIEEDVVDLEIADGVVVRVAKAAIARKLES
jgi:preprotein translocase subunit YajC